MLKFLEKNFFMIVQRIGLLFALISLVAVVILGLVSYEKLNSEVSDKISTPVINFSQYQNPVDINPSSVDKTVASTFNARDISASIFNSHIDTIVNSLKQLPDGVVGKSNLRDRVEILVKIKTSAYSKELQLAYTASLAELTPQLINTENHQIDIDDFLKWHHQEFSTQVSLQTQGNLLKMSSVKAQKAAGFIALNMAAAALGIFIMFVMMLAMLRIEQNTRQ
ncbi:MAG: hypothetical protein NZ702_02395 [Gammaproteobacteria bacterium]|nr:hypothetical protein [Gammaproteobacteria bacterium]